MSPPFGSSAFDLIVAPNTFFVYQLPIHESLPQAVMDALIHPPTSDTIISVTRTSEEISIVTDIVLDAALAPPSLKRSEWKCLTMKGPMAFGELPLT